MGIINGKKVLSVVRTQYLSETERDLIARYHLGAFDSVVGNRITRQTGYLVLNGSEIGWGRNATNDTTNKGYYFYITVNDATTVASGAEISQIKATHFQAGSPNLVYGGNSDNAWVTYWSGDTHRLNFYDLTLAFKTVDELKAWLSQNNIVVQYKKTTSYTEQVIADRPLNTLDQNGSQWLRNEWEKGLNLWNFKGTQTKTQYGITTTLNDSILTISGTNTGEGVYFGAFEFSEPIKANKIYTITIPNQHGISITFYDANGNEITHTDYVDSFTFTPNVDIAQFTIWITGNSYAWGTTIIKLMLVEGDHAYPYQEYKGEIARVSDLPNMYITETNNPPSTIGTWVSMGAIEVSVGGFTNNVYLWKRLN